MSASTKAGTPTPPKHGSWGTVNSRQLIKNYDKSPMASPKHSPTHSPAVSRKNSSSSIKSIQSEPAWHSGRHQSEPVLRLMKERQESNASQASVQTTASHKKGSLMGGLFTKKTKEEKEFEKKEKERERAEKFKQRERIIITSKHAAAAKTRMMLDPQYKEFNEKHRKPSVKTAGITGHTPSAHSSAAVQEARHPHSGPPAVHGALDLPMLGRIDSHDEVDDEIDEYEKLRHEWNETHEPHMMEIPEIRSRQTSARPSPWGSPIQSRDSSPNRLGARPGIGSKRSSYAAYQKDPTGRWVKKTTPPTVTPPHYANNNGGVNMDTFAASLAERLEASA